MKNVTTVGRASTAADLVNIGAAEAGPTIMSGIAIVRRIAQNVGAAGVDLIIVKNMVTGEKVKTGIENIVLEMERRRKPVSVGRNLSRLSCYHVQGTNFLLRRDLHLLGCECFCVSDFCFKCLRCLNCIIDVSVIL
jgi:hypothetical protein